MSLSSFDTLVLTYVRVWFANAVWMILDIIEVDLPLKVSKMRKSPCLVLSLTPPPMTWRRSSTLEFLWFFVTVSVLSPHSAGVADRLYIYTCTKSKLGVLSNSMFGSSGCHESLACCSIMSSIFAICNPRCRRIWDSGGRRESRKGNVCRCKLGPRWKLRRERRVKRRFAEDVKSLKMSFCRRPIVARNKTIVFFS